MVSCSLEGNCNVVRAKSIMDLCETVSLCEMTLRGSHQSHSSMGLAACMPVASRIECTLLPRQRFTAQCQCRDAEKAAEVARAKYDEAKAQREMAEQKTAEHKRIEADQQSMQQRLQDAEAQLASMTEEIDHQAAALEQSNAARQQRDDQLAEAEEEVKRIMQQLAQAQALVEQLKEEISSVAVSAAILFQP